MLGHLLSNDANDQLFELRLLLQYDSPANLAAFVRIHSDFKASHLAGRQDIQRILLVPSVLQVVQAVCEKAMHLTAKESG